MLAGCPSAPESKPSEPDAAVQEPRCGDGTCNGSETASSCPADCGNNNQPRCGDGTCQASESQQTCPQDCGAPAVCGDGVCAATESSASCPADCDATLDVINNSSYTIWNLYVAACGSPTWGNDQLGGNVITAGHTFALHNIPPGCYGFRAQTQGAAQYWQTPSGVTLTAGENYTWTLTN